MIGTVTILVFLSRVLLFFLVVLPVMLIVTGAYNKLSVVCIVFIFMKAIKDSKLLSSKMNRSINLLNKVSFSSGGKWSV